MSALALVGSLVEFPAGRPLRRPFGVGLLPGRIYAMTGSVSDIEARLGLGRGSLSAHGSCELRRPHGLWKLCGADRLAWLGLRTDAHAPLADPPRSELGLAGAAMRIVDTGAELVSARLLTRAGWGVSVNGRAAFAELAADDGSLLGFAALLRLGEDVTEVEVYGNGQMWADTAPRLQRLVLDLAPLVEAVD